MMDGFDHAGVGTRLAAVLADTVVLFHGAHELPAFEPVVRTGFLDVHIFARLAAPDAHQRVPMVWRGNRDSVNLFILKQFADVHVSLWFWQAHLFDLANALARDVFIHIAESRKLGSRNLRESVDVIVAAAAHSTNADTHAIIRPKDSRVA